MTVTETETGTISKWNVTETSLAVDSLHPYYVYTVSVAAVTVGIGPYSDDVNITTDEAGEKLLCIERRFAMLNKDVLITF